MCIAGLAIRGPDRRGRGRRSQRPSRVQGAWFRRRRDPHGRPAARARRAAAHVAIVEATRRAGARCHRTMRARPGCGCSPCWPRSTRAGPHWRCPARAAPAERSPASPPSADSSDRCWCWPLPGQRPTGRCPRRQRPGATARRRRRGRGGGHHRTDPPGSRPRAVPVWLEGRARAGGRAVGRRRRAGDARDRRLRRPRPCRDRCGARRRRHLADAARPGHTARGSRWRAAVWAAKVLAATLVAAGVLLVIDAVFDV